MAERLRACSLHSVHRTTYVSRQTLLTALTRKAETKSARVIISADVAHALQKALRNSRLVSGLLEAARSHLVAQGYCQGLRIFENNQFSGGVQNREMPDPSSGRLRAYFDSHRRGNGIYKWNHYFEMYERHLAKFANGDATICEIGVYSGGSLEMWRNYFGARCRVYGVDIEPACKNYENSDVKILIGDQADRVFWKRFREKVPSLDVVIDDGGHAPRQQIITLEETLPHLNPGGVYICEDVHGIPNHFARYVNGLALNLNADRDFQPNEDNDRAITVTASPFQSAIRSVNLYPFAVVIERNEAPVSELVAPKRGTSWQPFM